MRRSNILPVALVTLAGCADEPDRTPIITEIPVAPCGAQPGLDDMQVVAEGTVVDFLTGAPHVGVTVDIARAWEPNAVFPADSCSLSHLTTDATGHFGPVTVNIGPRPSLFESKFIVFLAQGGGIAPTASDARVGTGTDSIAHTLAAPSFDLMDAWRAELVDDGMGRARTRGLVAFRYDDGNDVPAAGVVATRETLLDSDSLERGSQVRYLGPDRASLMPASQSTTTESGMALIGLSPTASGTVEVGGVRGGDDWGSVGTLVGEGWLFLEWSRML
jgi:hypothetical protein